MWVRAFSKGFCLAVFLTVAALATAQQPDVPKLFHDEQPPPGALQFDTGNKARHLVDCILTQYGLKLIDNQWEVRIDGQNTATPNAGAGTYQGKRLVVFNKSFMDRLAKARDGDWLVYAIAAHEIGHHLTNHVLRLAFLPRQQAEREADYQAGFVLGRLGATFSQTTGMVRWLPDAGAGNYPPRSQRLCELGRGWRDATRRSPMPSDAAEGKLRKALLCTDDKPDPKRFKLLPNYDIYGHDIKFEGREGVPGLDVAGCALLCEVTANCKAFSFDRWNGWCYVKDEIVPATEDPPSIIGIKEPAGDIALNTAAKRRMEFAGNKRFLDRPISSATIVKTLGECRQQCSDYEQCKVYSFHTPSKRCEMFGQTEGPYIDDDYLSGFKQQPPDQPPPPAPPAETVKRPCT